jgi:hypothetical protein
VSTLDKLAERGVGPLLEFSDGEPIKILTGPDAGKSFIGSVTTMADNVLDDILSRDVRPHRQVAFRIKSGVPKLARKERIQRTSGPDAGKIYTATITDFNDYVFQTFEIQEVTDKDS